MEGKGRQGGFTFYTVVDVGATTLLLSLDPHLKFTFSLSRHTRIIPLNELQPVGTKTLCFLNLCSLVETCLFFFFFFLKSVAFSPSAITKVLSQLF